MLSEKLADRSSLSVGADEARRLSCPSAFITKFTQTLQRWGEPTKEGSRSKKCYCCTVPLNTYNNAPFTVDSYSPAK